jgi:hypothetical protein
MIVPLHGRKVMPAPAGLRIAVLTTIVPGKEPVELVMATLRAMRRIRHDGPIDVWLLDEGDDADVRRCAEIGVKHFSRKGHPRWNQAEGQFRGGSRCRPDGRGGLTATTRA